MSIPPMKLRERAREVARKTFDEVHMVSTGDYPQTLNLPSINWGCCLDIIENALLTYSNERVEAEQQRACAFLTKLCWSEKNIQGFLDWCQEPGQLINKEKV